MAVGLPGVIGDNVLQPAKLEKYRERGSATTQPRDMVGRAVNLLAVKRTWNTSNVQDQNVPVGILSSSKVFLLVFF